MNNIRKRNTVNLTLIALFTALLSVSSYISIPLGTVSFTLQTFAIYMCIFCLGAKRGLLAIGVYILGGIIGLPLFSGFSGGMAVILGPSGGYILGFLPSALVCALLLRLFKDRKWKYFASSIISLPICYLTGTLWYCGMYLGNLSRGSFLSALSICTLPYIIPDAVKLIAASILGARINKIIIKMEKGIYNV